MDLIVNNINEEASIYKNTAVDTKKDAAHNLQIDLSSAAPNINGIGAIVELQYGGGKQQVAVFFFFWCFFFF